MLNKITSIPKLSGNTSRLIAPITPGEVEYAIKKQRVGKSPGSDGFTAEFYKYFSTNLCDILCEVFNHTLSWELYPCHKD